MTRFFYFDDEITGIAVNSSNKTWYWFDMENPPDQFFELVEELKLGEVIQVGPDQFDLDEHGYFDENDEHFFERSDKEEFLNKVFEFIDNYEIKQE